MGIDARFDPDGPANDLLWQLRTRNADESNAIVAALSMAPVPSDPASP